MEVQNATSNIPNYIICVTDTHVCVQVCNSMLCFRFWAPVLCINVWYLWQC